MKRNAFGDPILQPGDDIVAAFMDRFNSDVDLTLTARFLEKDPSFNWSATLADMDGNEMEVHDFESEEELRDFLTEQDIEIEA